MKINLILLSLFFNAFVSYSQPCESFSLGQFFNELKQLEYYKHGLKLSKHGSFDFVSFKPIGQITDSSNYVVVGYDGRNKIRQINVYNLDRIYALEVHDLKDHRILLLKFQDASKEWLFTPIAIFLSDCGNYMINVHSVFENNYDPYKLSNYFPITTFENISCLMSLRHDLYPNEFVRFSMGKIVTYSGLKYEFERSRKLQIEAIHFFIGTEELEGELEIGTHSSMKEIIERTILLRTKSNLIVFTKPEVFEDLVSPLWVFGGAHSYFLNK